ncbi:hypothetical protein BLA50215_07445 [Burkholderia lata]|uniref:hypothetical protein n=1 Tax=Burkholderia lata (strain ATCC 17760 / DSM 23089 / LMG 22485 / NCIMB 9086 / R18194 / 383) TaxID=482957 RepID=UPI001452C781|nr:hypothetical protein [Burkholderia lata]VWD61703.1 hypothetical protein BLA50215_07445 [Burkholderia lata]
MRSPWNNVIAVLDADTLRVWTNDGWRARRAGEPHVVVAHDGLPAEALAQVLGGLPKARLPMRNRVHVVAGHPWTLGVVLPWQDGLVSDAAWDGYARALFAARAQRGALRIRIEAGRRGRARLAVAVCDTLLAALAEVTRAAGWRLVSVRDALSASLDAHAGRLTGDDCRYALLQPRVVTCVFRRAGEWADVVTLPRTGGRRLDDWFAAAALMAGQPLAGAAFASALDGALPVADGVTLLDGGPDDVPLREPGEPA